MLAVAWWWWVLVGVFGLLALSYLGSRSFRRGIRKQYIEFLAEKRPDIKLVLSLFSKTGT